jgi:hypothetical protein
MKGEQARRPARFASDRAAPTFCPVIPSGNGSRGGRADRASSIAPAVAPAPNETSRMRRWPARPARRLSPGGSCSLRRSGPVAPVVRDRVQRPICRSDRSARCTTGCSSGSGAFVEPNAGREQLATQPAFGNAAVIDEALECQQWWWAGWPEDGLVGTARPHWPGPPCTAFPGGGAARDAGASGRPRGGAPRREPRSRERPRAGRHRAGATGRPEASNGL